VQYADSWINKLSLAKYIYHVIIRNGAFGLAEFESHAIKTNTTCPQLVKGAGCQIEPAIRPVWVI